MVMDYSITVMEKPEWVSWDSIHDVLWAAHQQNIRKGMTMRNPYLTGEELKKLMGDSGHCFVAMEEDKVIGSAAFVIQRYNKWYTKGKKTAYLFLGAIRPEDQVKGVYSRLKEIRQQFIDKLHVDVIEMETAEQNHHIQDIMLKDGFKYISFRKAKKSDFNYVVLVKWPDKCPYPDWYIKLRFLYSKIKTKLR